VVEKLNVKRAESLKMNAIAASATVNIFSFSRKVCPDGKKRYL
jgi:hypothetical protein